MTTTKAQAKAHEMVAAIAAGRTLFTRTAEGAWLIVGPAADITTGARVVVTKADGSTRTVVVTTLGVENTKGGVTYRVAAFREMTAADKVRATRSYAQIMDAAHARSIATCEHGDRDNNGDCYSCGHYSAAHDVARHV